VYVGIHDGKYRIGWRWWKRRERGNGSTGVDGFWITIIIGLGAEKNERREEDGTRSENSRVELTHARLKFILAKQKNLQTSGITYTCISFLAAAAAVLGEKIEHRAYRRVSP